MPTYRVQTRDGARHTVRALRLRTDHHRLYLEHRDAGSWRAVLEVPLNTIEHLQRRLNEPDGSWTWITEAPGPYA